MADTQIATMEEFFAHEIQDLYSAEQQIIKALPKMIEAAASQKLQKGFEEHLEQTKEHAKRLEQIAKDLDIKLDGVVCKGMEGVIKEGEEAIKDLEDGAVRDAALIGAAQRVEHYEIAGYGSAHAHAHLLGQDDAAGLLDKTLQEEGETDKKLTQLAETEINEEATEAG